MDSENLVISTGLKRYNINGVELAFNPTDTGFAEKLYNIFSQLDNKQKDYENRVKNAKDGEVFAVMRSCDSDMREMLDTGLGVEGLSNGVFGTISVFAFADGLPLWANLLMALLDQMDSSVIEEQQKSNARVKYYTDKYSKKYHK